MFKGKLSDHPEFFWQYLKNWLNSQGFCRPKQFLKNSKKFFQLHNWLVVGLVANTKIQITWFLVNFKVKFMDYTPTNFVTLSLIKLLSQAKWMNEFIDFYIKVEHQEFFGNILKKKLNLGYFKNCFSPTVLACRWFGGKYENWIYGLHADKLCETVPYWASVTR